MNVLLHWSQAKGRSPECTRRCLVKSPLSEVPYSHSWHWYQTLVRLPVEDEEEEGGEEDREEGGRLRVMGETSLDGALPIVATVGERDLKPIGKERREEREGSGNHSATDHQMFFSSPRNSLSSRGYVIPAKTQIRISGDRNTNAWISRPEFPPIGLKRWVHFIRKILLRAWLRGFLVFNLLLKIFV